MRGTLKQAKDYCTKEDTRVAGPWEKGEMPEPGKRTDIEAVKEAIDKGATNEELWDGWTTAMVKYWKSFREYKRVKAIRRTWDTETTVIWGSTGKGKTTWVEKHHPDAYWFSAQSGDAWFDGYEGEKTLVIDEFYGNLPFQMMLRLSDHSPLQVPVKGGFVNFSATRIYILSNTSPDMWYTELKDRGSRWPAFLRRLNNIWVCTDNTQVGTFLCDKGRPQAQMEALLLKEAQEKQPQPEREQESISDEDTEDDEQQPPPKKKLRANKN
jgi:hypothetical protein